jgi:hypothetical protein
MQENASMTYLVHTSPHAHVPATDVASSPPQHDDQVRELNEARMNALRLIDEGGFSCVATSLALIPPTSSLFLTVRRCSWFHLKVCLVAGTGFFTDA